MAEKRTSYDNNSISALRGEDRVRLRPAVIFGSDGLEGCEHSVFEILSNSVDEAREGYGDRIIITVYTDHTIEIEDFGRGVPMGYNEKEKRYNWELVYCELYAGSKYNNNTDDATSAELAIVENLLRENLNMFEQAEAFDRLIREFHLTQEEAARRVSMSQSAVANKLRILRLSSEEREKILSAGLSERHARALLKLSDVSLRGEALDHILAHKLNVSATEAYIERVCVDLSRLQARREQELQQKAALERAQMLEEEEIHLPEAIQNVIEGRRTRFKGSIKDMQVFYNSIQNALNILHIAGIEGQLDKQEGENNVVLTITLRKAEQFR